MEEESAKFTDLSLQVALGSVPVMFTDLSLKIALVG
jgi:hypothetical protein